MRIWSPLLALVALLAVASGSTAAHKCSDPCLMAARSMYRECVSSATGAFTDAIDACVERDLQCVNACRFDLEDCRDGTGADAEVAACQGELVAAKAECRTRFPPGSRRLVVCIDRAEFAGVQCLHRVVQRFRQARKDCRSGFKQCAATCGPGGPPGGTDTCRAEGKAAVKADLASCKLTFQVSASACINKNLTCFQGCGDARDTCTAPTQSMLAAAVLACTAQERADVAACQAANPGGGTALDQCITTAKANAFTCRDAALNAASPALEACAVQYVGCVRACPPA